MKKVWIKKQALNSIILSAVEVYKHETLGLLFGYQKESGFVIDNAFPYQTANRSCSWTVPKNKSIKIIKELSSIMNIKIIGDYHSHCQWGSNLAMPVPSGDDIADMNLSKVYIIISINKKNGRKREEDSLSINLGTYYLELKAFYLIAKNKPETLKIVII